MNGKIGAQKMRNMLLKAHSPNHENINANTLKLQDLDLRPLVLWANLNIVTLISL